MTFGAANAQAPDGTIAPEGGCPGKFFTSRKWTYDQGGLIMRDHTGQPLAQLTGAGGRFDGRRPRRANRWRCRVDQRRRVASIPKIHFSPRRRP